MRLMAFETAKRWFEIVTTNEKVENKNIKQ